MIRSASDTKLSKGFVSTVLDVVRQVLRSIDKDFKALHGRDFSRKFITDQRLFK